VLLCCLAQVELSVGMISLLSLFHFTRSFVDMISLLSLLITWSERVGTICLFTVRYMWHVGEPQYTLVHLHVFAISPFKTAAHLVLY